MLSTATQSAIAQHHEKPDGSGYPKGLFQQKISPEASVLSIACLFDELTTVKIGRARLDPRAALEQISLLSAIPADLLLKLRASFGNQHRE